jgi:hypothetical protein
MVRKKVIGKTPGKVTQIIQAAAECGVKSLRVFESGAFDVTFVGNPAWERTGVLPTMPLKPAPTSTPFDSPFRPEDIPNQHRTELNRLDALEGLRQNAMSPLDDESDGV